MARPAGAWRRPDADGVPMTPERVSGFLIRMIFTMFAEDVGLIPEGKFKGALESMKGRPEAFVPSGAGFVAGDGQGRVQRRAARAD